MSKKLISLILCLGISIGLLAGCGKVDTSDTTSKDESKTVASNEVEEEESTEPVHLRLVMYGEAGNRNIEFFENEFNERIKEDLNMTIEVDYLAWGDVAKMEAMLAAGEEFAMMIYPNQYSLLKKEYLAEIPEEMIRENAPNLMNARMGLDFNSCKYAGVNYIIPVGAQVFSGAQDNLNIRNDILNKVGLDYKDIKTFDDLTAACIKVKEAFPEMEIGSWALFPTNLEAGDRLDGKCGLEHIYTDHNDPDSDEIYAKYGSENYKKDLEQFYEWKALGFYDNEQWVLEGSKYANAAFQAGNSLMRYGETSRIIDHQLSGVESAEVQYLEIENNQAVMNFNYDWGWAISAEADAYKDDLLRLIDWIYASKDNYTFALNGVQGVDWDYAEDGKTIVNTTGDLFFYRWQFQTMYYMNSEDYDSEEWERYITHDSKAINSKLIGFVLDTTPIEVERAAISAVISEYGSRYLYDSYEEWAEVVLPKLEEAGYQKYVDEVQRQVSAWWAEAK